MDVTMKLDRKDLRSLMAAVVAAGDAAKTVTKLSDEAAKETAAEAVLIADKILELANP